MTVKTLKEILSKLDNADEIFMNDPNPGSDPESCYAVYSIDISHYENHYKKGKTKPGKQVIIKGGSYNE